MEAGRERLWVAVPAEPAARAGMSRLVNAIAVVAVLDAVLLGFLLWASFSHNETLVSILGPIHGAGYVALLAMCARGSSQGNWGWWFPALVLVTLGPLGSLIGDVRVRRRLDAEQQ